MTWKKTELVLTVISFGKGDKVVDLYLYLYFIFNNVLYYFIIYYYYQHVHLIPAANKV